MGWFITDTGTMRTIWHGGNVLDFSAFMALLPRQKKGVVLLVNADHYGLPPILAEVGLSLTALLAGQTPAPIRLGFIPWVMRALPLIPILQFAGAAVTLWSVRRWRRDPAHRPSRGRLWVGHIVLPAVLNLIPAAGALALLGSSLRGFLMLFVPDLSWIALICGGFAGIWAFLHTGLILRTLREPSRRQ